MANWASCQDLHWQRLTVVDVKTSHGVYKRPVTKVALLLTNENWTLLLLSLLFVIILTIVRPSGLGRRYVVVYYIMSYIVRTHFKFIYVIRIIRVKKGYFVEMASWNSLWHASARSLRIREETHTQVMTTLQHHQCSYIVSHGPSGLGVLCGVCVTL